MSGLMKTIFKKLPVSEIKSFVEVIFVILLVSVWIFRHRQQKKKKKKIRKSTVYGDKDIEKYSAWNGNLRLTCYSTKKINSQHKLHTGQ